MYDTILFTQNHYVFDEREQDARDRERREETMVELHSRVSVTFCLPAYFFGTGSV